MFKQRYVLEVKGNEERLYQFMVPSDAPLGEIHDALQTMKSIVLDQLHESFKKDKSEKDSEYFKEQPAKEDLEKKPEGNDE